MKREGPVVAILSAARSSAENPPEACEHLLVTSRRHAEGADSRQKCGPADNNDRRSQA